MGDVDEQDLTITSGRRRITRQSTRRVSSVEESNNPYKKPVYQLGGGSSSNDSSNDSVSSAKRGRGRPSASSAEKTPTVTPSKRGGKRGGRTGTPAPPPPPVVTPTSSKSTPKTRGTPHTGRGSAGRKRGTKRPECISSRTPKSARGRKKSRRSYYNSSDYHYGSDFDEDEEDEEEEDGVEFDEDDDELLEDDTQEDLDMELDEEIDGTLAIPDELMVPPPPLYDIEVEPTTNLVLPKSSEDLLIDKNLIIQAVGVFEPLRRFSNLIRLTQFRFEDFCAALAAIDEQSSLLVEIHVQLLKALLREEDLISTTFGPPEVKDSIQSVLYFIDHVTWSETLRHYLNCDPQWSAAYNLVKTIDYPFCSVETRLDILTFLINQFLSTTPVRDILSSEVIRHEDHCRSCARLGELICCESCPAVYHLECIEPPLKKNPETGLGEVPDEWKCCICKKDEMTETGDCVSELERAGLLIRQEKIGYDRHGRKYWFLVRRIIVEDENKNECWYYTTKPQLTELLYCLEGEQYEEKLLKALHYIQDEVERQMEVTEELTNSAAQHRRTWLDIENTAIQKLNEERELILEQEEVERARKREEEAAAAAKAEEERQKVEEELRRREEDEKRKIREERLAKRNEEKAKLMEERELGLINDLIRDQELRESEKMDESSEEKLGETNEQRKEEEITGSESDTSKAENANEDNSQTSSKTATATSSDTVAKPAEPKVIKKPTITKESLTTLIQSDIERHTRLKSQAPFKLGQENLHKTYTNSYTSDPLALSKQQHQEERDRKRHTSHKFSLTTASEFKWTGNVNTTRANIITTIKQTLAMLEANLPSTLLHINWTLVRRTWLVKVHTAKDQDLPALMMELVDSLRPCLFNSVWIDGAGHLKLVRVLASEREEKKKLEKFEKKWKDDEEERYRMAGLVKYTIPLKHQVFKQKGEEYRIHGQYGWQWLSKLRPNIHKPSNTLGLRAGPQRHVIQVKGDDGVVKTMLIDPNVYDKLMAKRLASERTGIQYDKVKLKNGKIIPWEEYLEMLDKGEEMDLPYIKKEQDQEEENGLKEQMSEMIGEVEKMEKTPEQAVLEELIDQVVASESAEVKGEVDVKPDAIEADIINVSKGLVLAHRIQFPKIAAAAPVCDELLAKRTRLLLIEEMALKRKFGVSSNICYCHGCPAYCYSPTCMNNMVIKERVYSTTDTKLSIHLKRNPADVKKSDTLAITNISSKFRARRGYSVLILPKWELSKLARSGGRSYVPAGFNSAKNWGNYPCGRPNFRTAWMFRTITGCWSFACLGLQLRVLWACIRWDDLQMKAPAEGKSQVTTDTEIITNELLNHRIAGRFNEKVQYLRKRHIVPIDAAPTVKTVVVKDALATTPSRLGLRKRKRVSTPVESDPTVLEEWVDEDKLELWEIRYYGERKLSEKNTRLKSGVQLNKPEKYDPSTEVRTPNRRSVQSVVSTTPVTPVALPKEPEPIDSKVAHISKRDNHAKITAPVKTPEPTASELLQMQQTIAQKAFCSRTTANTYAASANSVAGRKFFMSKTQERMRQVAGEVLKNNMQANTNNPRQPNPTNPTPVNVTTTPGIIRLAVPTTSAPISRPTVPNIINSSRTPTSTQTIRIGVPATSLTTTRLAGTPVRVQANTTAQPRSLTPASANLNIITPTGQQSRLQVFKGEDGKLQIRGLLPGQHCYQTADGKIHIVGVAASNLPSTASPQGLNPRIISAQPRATIPQQVQSVRAVSTAVQPRLQVTQIQSTKPLQQNPVTQTQTTAATQRHPALQIATPSQVQINPGTIIQQRLPVVSAQAQPLTIVQQRLPATQIQPGTAQRLPVSQNQSPILLQQSQGTTQNQLPISIVSPSKQPQQQTLHLIQGPDGRQYFARHPLTVVRRILPSGNQANGSPASAGSPVRLIMRGGTNNPSMAPIRLIVRGGVPGQTPIVIRTSGGQTVIQGAPVTSAGIQSPARPQSVSVIPNVTSIVTPKMESVQNFQATTAQNLQPRPTITSSVLVSSTTNLAPIPQPPIITLVSSPMKTEPISVQPRQINVTTPVALATPPQAAKLVAQSSSDASFISQQQLQQTAPRPISPQKKQSPIITSPLPLQPPPIIVGLSAPVKSESSSPLNEVSKVASTPPTQTFNVSSKPELVSVNTPVQRDLTPKPSSPQKKQSPVITLPPISAQPPVIVGLSTPVKAEAQPAVLTQKSPRKESPSSPRKEPLSSPNKQVAPVLQPQLPQAAKALLFNHKEALKDDIMKKRALLEAQINAEIQEEMRMAKKRRRSGEIDKDYDNPTSFCLACSQAITPLQFIVACTTCNTFFHGACVDFTKEELNQGKVYNCTNCQLGTETDVVEEVVETTPTEPARKRKKTGRKSESKGKDERDDDPPKELYCTCKRPYDDSYFYIQCEACEDWFHGCCVGVLPIEGTTIDDYRCPNCAPDSQYNQANYKRLTQNDLTNLRSLIKQILTMKDMHMFYHPVDPKLFPNYRKIIRQPMELKTIEQRLEQGVYTKLADFVSDACRMFDNCKHYNPGNSKISKKAGLLEGFLVQKLRLLRQKILMS